jgi:hypothetical protein
VGRRYCRVPRIVEIRLQLQVTNRDQPPITPCNRLLLVQGGHAGQHAALQQLKGGATWRSHASVGESVGLGWVGWGQGRGVGVTDLSMRATGALSAAQQAVVSGQGLSSQGTTDRQPAGCEE